MKSVFLTLRLLPFLAAAGAWLTSACSPASNEPSAAGSATASALPTAPANEAQPTATGGAPSVPPTLGAGSGKPGPAMSTPASAPPPASVGLPTSSATTSSSVSAAPQVTTSPSASVSSSPSGATTSVTNATPSTSGSAAPPMGVCGGADVLCADFDDLAAGSLPTGAPWLAAPGHCAATGYKIGAKSGTAVSGMQALESSNASTSTNACALVADLGEQTDFWVRAQVRYVGTGPTNEHEITFFELGEHPDQDDPEGRVGFRSDGCNATNGNPFPGLEFNMTKGPGGEFTGCTGVPLAADTWYCVEVHVDQSASPTTGRLYLDGAEQMYTNHGSPVEEVLADGPFRYLKLGAQTYGGINTGPLLLDDVAVGTSRIGCP